MAMKLLLEIKENKADALLALLRDLPYVKVHPVDDNGVRFLSELQEAIEEIKLIKAGKLEGRPAEELLDEL
ncbi:hypothetical protein [Parapedobacter soli]|uniref:hypothetical protein n=1 Tax=Parapedobacter soli TaxID=416955 RepID=UPI0021C589F9|nr:hypothetical protein [Parapedobacter soli]